MIYCNLTQQKLPNDVKTMMFPMGEFHVTLPKYDDITVFYDFTQDVFNLSIVLDAWERMYNFNRKPAKAILYCPYLPYARQDRVVNKGEENGLENIIMRLDEFGFTKLITFDLHSHNYDYRILTKPTITDIPQYIIASQAVNDFKPDFLISPDNGAFTKTRLLSKIKNIPVVQCHKKRDPETGKLSGFEIVQGAEFIKGKGLLVDDICDGGGTFIGIAKLFENNHLGLYVTHGGFTKGLGDLLDCFEKIYTTNSYPHHLLEFNKFKIFNVWNYEEYV